MYNLFSSLPVAALSSLARTIVPEEKKKDLTYIGLSSRYEKSKVENLVTQDQAR